MADLTFTCVACGEPIKAEARDVGKQGPCPACGATTLVRRPGEPASACPPAAAPVPPVRPAPARQTSGYAIASLVCGILSLPGVMCGGFILGIIGITLSLVARARIRNDPRRWEGEGLAVAGLVTSIVGVAVGVLAMLVFGGMLLAAGGMLAFLAKVLTSVHP